MSATTELFFRIVSCYPQLHAAFRSRAEELNASRLTLDAESGLTDGYCSKILGPKPIKGVISQTALEPMLKALRLRIIVLDDQEVAAARGELPQRDRSQVRLGNDSRRSKGRTKPKYVPKRKVAKPTRGKPYLSKSTERRPVSNLG